MSPFSLFPNLLKNERHNDNFKREISSQLFVFLSSSKLKLSVTRCTGERNDITDIGHTCNKQ